MKTVAPEHGLNTRLNRMAVETGNAALMLGRDLSGRPVPVRLFREQPTVAVFIGGWWAARVLVFRCLGLGAQVALRCRGGLGSTAEWSTLDLAAGGTGLRVWPMPEDPWTWQSADATRTTLRVYDVGLTGPPVRPVLGPWQTQLTVLAQLTDAGTGTVTACDLVLAQRMIREEAELLAGALGHGESTVDLLTGLDTDMVALCARGTAGLARLTPTTVERRLFGLPSLHGDSPSTLAVQPSLLAANAPNPGVKAAHPRR